MTQITFIAGGSKGLGESLVKQFLAADYDVKEFSRTGNKSSHIDCDFSLPTQATNIFKKTFDSFSEPSHTHINLIINTAILAPFGTLKHAKDESIATHFKVNIESTLMLIQIFLKAFQNTKARKTLTYISSGAARQAIPGLAMYSASKAFFERLIATMAEEQNTELHPIKAMVINPGIMNTDMQTEIRSQDADDFPLVGLWNDFYKNGQLAVPSDVAGVCKNLITQTGTNGGYYQAQDYIKQQQTT